MMVERRWPERKYHDRVLGRMLAKRKRVDGPMSTMCWEWTGWRSTEGYGWTHFNGRKESVHRTAYMILVGEVPDGLFLDHLCRNRACFNPAHLEPVTCRENLLRGVGASGMNARKTHCKHGHEFDEANTWFEKTGHRHCRACNRRRMLQRPSRSKVRITEVRIAEPRTS